MLIFFYQREKLATTIGLNRINKEKSITHLHNKINQKLTVITTKMLNAVLLNDKEKIGIDLEMEVFGDNLANSIAREYFPIITKSTSWIPSHLILNCILIITSSFHPLLWRIQRIRYSSPIGNPEREAGLCTCSKLFPPSGWSVRHISGIGSASNPLQDNSRLRRSEQTSRIRFCQSHNSNEGWREPVLLFHMTWNDGGSLPLENNVVSLQFYEKNSKCEGRLSILQKVQWSEQRHIVVLLIVKTARFDQMNEPARTAGIPEFPKISPFP